MNYNQNDIEGRTYTGLYFGVLSGIMSNSIVYIRFLRRPLEMTKRSNFSRTNRKHYKSRVFCEGTVRIAVHSFHVRSFPNTVA
jgi:hypothetical protein